MTKVMFAVIKSGGRQYKVSVGQTLEVNRLPVEVGEQVHFNEVMLISDANNTMIGTPLIENAAVLATATKQGRGKKLIVFKYKPKKRIRHRRGHRQELTILTIEDIVADGKSLITGEAPKSRQEEDEMLPVIAEVETPAESTEVEAATGEVSETGDADEEEKKTSRRRRTRRSEESESEVEE